MSTFDLSDGAGGGDDIRIELDYKAAVTSSTCGPSSRTVMANIDEFGSKEVTAWPSH